MQNIRTRTPSAALGLIAALALAACGSSEPPSTDSAGAAHARDSSHYIVHSTDPISNSDRPSVPQTTWPGPHSTPAEGSKHGASEPTQTEAAPMNPCHLVSKDEAGHILGEAVQVTLGLQGPTCIYEGRRSGRQVTLVVERVDLGALRRHAARAHRVRVGGEFAWCLRYGSDSVAAPLNDGLVLDVTGSCAIAARFAAPALERASQPG